MTPCTPFSPPSLLLHLVPNPPGRTCGVYDYATTIALAIAASSGIQSAFIPVNDSTGNLAPNLFDTIDHHLLDRNATTTTLVIHYTAYGFDRRSGIPSWLLRLIERLRSKHSLTIAIIFHEFFYHSPRFWRTLRQQQLCLQLAKLADAIVVNRQWCLDFLARRDASLAARCLCLPVFSNIGELTQLPPQNTRKNSFIIFGGRHWTERLLIHNMRQMRRVCECLEVTDVICIGSKTQKSIALDVPCVQLGFLPSHAASEILRQSRFGAFYYPPRDVGKSGVFAAYAAHGLVSINFYLGYDRDCDAVEGIHYLSADKCCSRTSQEHDRISQAVHSWYGDHNIYTTSNHLIGIHLQRNSVA